MKKARRASKTKAPSHASRKPVTKKKQASPSRKIITSHKTFSKNQKQNLTKRPSELNRSIEVEPMSMAVPQVPSNAIINDLPFSYNHTTLILMIRDPNWAYAYWDFSADTWNWIVSFREQDHGAKPKLRIHNLTESAQYDVDIFLDAKNWYLELGKPNTEFEVELGIMDSGGKFHSIAKSNRARTPRNAPSENIDPHWNLSEFEMNELYRLSGGGKTGHGSEIFSSIKKRR